MDIWVFAHILVHPLILQLNPFIGQSPMQEGTTYQLVLSLTSSFAALELLLCALL